MQGIKSFIIRNDKDAKVFVSVQWGTGKEEFNLMRDMYRTVKPPDTVQEDCIMEVYIGERITVEPSFKCKYQKNGMMAKVTYGSSGRVDTSFIRH